MVESASLDRIQTAMLELFALDTSALESISTERRGKECFVHVQLKRNNPPCPRCGSENPKIANYVNKAIKHSILQSEPCTLLYRARRYECPFCHKTYYEKNPFVFKKQKISVHTVMDVLHDLRDSTATFSSVARKHNISPTTAQNIFDRHVVFPEPTQLARVIEIDESYSFRSRNSKYVCMILDFETQEPIDLLPNRKKLYLENYFFKFPREERNKVKYIATDMYETYRAVIHTCFPRAVHAVDRFHVIQDYQRRLTAVRIRVMKGTHAGSDSYYLLKHQHQLLNIPPDAFKTVNGKKQKTFDPAAQRTYNSHFKKPMNEYELLNQLLKISPELNLAYLMKNRLCDLFRLTDKKKAETTLKEIIREMDNSGVAELKAAAGTLLNWYQEILNSFEVVKVEYEVSNKDGSVHRKDRRLTSSMIENRNKIVKAVKHNANGYSQWDRFRKRCLFVLKPNSPILLEPLEMEIKIPPK